MRKIYKYIFQLSLKYIFLNLSFILILVLFLNILEISRLIENKNMNLNIFIILSFLKIPSIISDTSPFVITLAVSFLFRNLINNNEFIAIRNVGYSIFDIFKPIGLVILIFGLSILVIINPISAKFEREFNNLTTKDFSDIYSIKFFNNEVWIKNIIDEYNSKNFINIKKIDLNNMKANDIKILQISLKENKIILAKEGNFEDKIFNLKNVIIFNINNDEYKTYDKYNFKLNFNNQNIIDSISNYKFIPFYKYKEHINNLKKFNIHSSEVSLYYLSQILKPFFLLVIAFTVMGFSGKFKKNENFFKVLFISILIGFLIFLFNEIIITLTTKFQISYIFSYFIIFIFPLSIGLLQNIKIESD